jgi:hypothetical protein
MAGIGTADGTEKRILGHWDAIKPMYLRKTGKVFHKPLN